MAKVVYFDAFGAIPKREFTKPDAVISKRGRAPHVAIVEKAKGLGADALKDGWERAFGNLLYDLRRAVDIDPILQTLLLKRVRGWAAAGSLPMKELLDKDFTVEALERIDDTQPWMKPADLPERGKAELALASLKDFQPLADRAAKATARADQEHRTGYVAAGWLLQDREKNWRMHAFPTEPALRNATLWTFAASAGAGAQLQLHPLGVLENGEPKLASSHRCRAYALVFAEVPQ